MALRRQQLPGFKLSHEQVSRITDAVLEEVRAWQDRPLDPVGAENCVTLCDLGILTDQAAEPVPPQHLDIRAWNRWLRAPGGRVLLQGPMRPVSVVVIDVLLENEPQVPLAGDQHPVQALAAGTGNPAFRDRVGPHRQRHLVQMTGIDVCR